MCTCICTNGTDTTMELRKPKKLTKASPKDAHYEAVISGRKYLYKKNWGLKRGEDVFSKEAHFWELRLYKLNNRFLVQGSK